MTAAEALAKLQTRACMGCQTDVYRCQFCVALATLEAHLKAEPVAPPSEMESAEEFANRLVNSAVEERDRGDVSDFDGPTEAVRERDAAMFSAGKASVRGRALDAIESPEDLIERIRDDATDVEGHIQRWEAAPMIESRDAIQFAAGHSAGHAEALCDLHNSAMRDEAAKAAEERGYLRALDDVASALGVGAEETDWSTGDIARELGWLRSKLEKGNE